MTYRWRALHMIIVPSCESKKEYKGSNLQSNSKLIQIEKSIRVWFKNEIKLDFAFALKVLTTRCQPALLTTLPTFRQAN